MKVFWILTILMMLQFLGCAEKKGKDLEPVMLSSGIKYFKKTLLKSSGSNKNSTPDESNPFFSLFRKARRGKRPRTKLTEMDGYILTKKGERCYSKAWRFEKNSELILGCTVQGRSSRPWCATKVNSETKLPEKWDFCVKAVDNCHGTLQGKTCQYAVFMGLYLAKNECSYHSMDREVPWCSLVSGISQGPHYDHPGRTWDYCNCTFNF